MKRIALILAAGNSSRLGRPKQLFEVQGQTLLERTIVECKNAGVNNVHVVTGAFADQTSAIAIRCRCSVVFNRNWQHGMGSSVACGISRILSREETQECIVLIRTCDQSFIPANHLRSLLDTTTKHRVISATEYTDGRSGIPACFPHDHLAELESLGNDTGAKHVIRNNPAITLLCREAELDIDTPDDLQRLRDLVRLSQLPKA